MAAALLALATLPAGCRRKAADTPFHIATPYELTTLDPHRANTVSNFAVLSNVYEPLVVTDADMKVQPALATTWENPDALTWVLHLRRGVTFQSGRPLQANDVVYSLRRLLDHPELDMRVYMQNLAAVRARDPFTIELKTTRPSRILLNKLHFALVIPDGATTESLRARPDGTGPYAVAAWTEGRQLALRRHEGYWGPRPALAHVRFVLGQRAEAAATGLLDGRFQLVQGSGKAVEARLRESGHEVLRHENIYVKYLGYDVGREETPFCQVKPNPFRNPEVRRALDIGLDRKALVDALPVHAVPASQVVPRFIFGFDPALRPSQPDLGLARKLLQEAGLGAGFPVTLHTRRLFAAAAHAVATQLREIGVMVSVIELGEQEFFALHDGGRLSLWITRYGCPSGDASDFLDDVVHSRDPQGEYGYRNGGLYHDPETDAAIEASAEVENVDDRRRAVQQLIARINEKRIMLPLYLDLDVYGLSREFSWQPRNDSYIRAADVRPRPPS